ncbi:MAG: putative Ig domain-containing protein, partial [Bacteroidales bacterium]|nr:putative Ig domain-containing protein [Bacteroidales bacterium]
AGRIDAFAAVTAAASLVAPLVADFEASAVVIAEGGTVDYTDLTTGTPTTWAWTFEGGTPSASTEQNPTAITYNTAGVYAVSLTAGDGTNEDTETKTYYILVGQSGSVAESGWIEQNTHFTSPYRGVFQTEIVDQNTAWVLTYDGSGGSITRDFARTTDAGATWIPDTIEVATNFAPGDLSAVDGLNAWVAVYDVNGGGGIYKTSDGGANWVHQASAAFDGASSFANVVHMFDVNNGYCMGDPNGGEFEIYTTSDGGENWVLLDGANIPNPETDEMGWTGVADAIGDIAWFGTNTGRIFKTTDRGLTWNVYETGQANVSTISFADESNGVAICQVTNATTGTIESWTMIKTANGGQTWTEIAVADQYLSDVSAVPGSVGMYVGTKISQTAEANFSAYSLDFGTTWTMIDDSVQYTNVAMFSETCGWAGGFNWDENNGGIYKWIGLAPSDEPYFTSSPSLSVTEFEEYTYNVVAEDPNDLSLTITAPVKPTWLNITDNGDGTATFTGTAPEIVGQSENFSVTLNASNGTYDADQSFVITVVTSNTAPEFTSDPILTNIQYIPYVYNVTATDPEGDDLTITADILPSWASFVDNGDGTGTVTGTPTSTSFLGFQIKLTVSDGMFTDVQDFRVQVTANSAPEFTSEPTLTHVQNTLYTYNITAIDDEGETLVITAPTLPSWASLVDNGDGTAVLSGTPTEANSPGYNIVLSVTDGNGTDTQDFMLEVTPNGIEDFGYGTIAVYPNPASNQITVTNCQGSNYEILDVMGRTLMMGQISSSEEIISHDAFETGNFIVKMVNNENIYTVKVVKL